MLPNTKVSANSGPPVIGVTVMPDVCEEDPDTYESIFPGNIDILVRVEDFDSDDFGPMTDKFKAFYPFYDDIEYLSNIPEGWISFSAYYTSTYRWGNSSHQCGMQFGKDEEVRSMKYLKVVYFDDSGDTLFISDEVAVPNVLFYQDMDSIIYLNTTTNTLEPHMVPRTDPYLFLVVIAILALILYSVIIEIIVAVVFKLRSKKALLNILLINFITQILMYFYFFIVFDSYEANYHMQLIIYELIVLVIEFGYLYWRLKPDITPKRIALYVFVSNLVSYLLGIVRYY